MNRFQRKLDKLVCRHSPEQTICIGNHNEDNNLVTNCRFLLICSCLQYLTSRFRESFTMQSTSLLISSEHSGSFNCLPCLQSQWSQTCFGLRFDFKFLGNLLLDVMKVFLGICNCKEEHSKHQSFFIWNLEAPTAGRLTIQQYEIQLGIPGINLNKTGLNLKPAAAAAVLLQLKFCLK